MNVKGFQFSFDTKGNTFLEKAWKIFDTTNI